MSVATAPESAGRVPAIVGGFSAPRWLRRIGSGALNVWAVIGLLYLFLPVFVIVAFSFNQPGTYRKGVFRAPTRSVYNYQWGRFSLNAWKNPFKYHELSHAFGNSLKIAAGSTIVARIKVLSSK